MRPTLRLENPIDTPRTLAARRSWASFPGAGGFGWLLAVLGCLAAPGSGAGAEPLLEGRVLLSSGAPAAGARVRLFAELGRSLRVTTDESGYFALPLTALRRAAPLPARLHLGQNYPNPFNPSTIIPYQLPVPVRVRLEVFNILGQRVATLVDGERPAGFHTAAWDATDASGRGVGSGVYLYRLLGGGERLTRSMVLLDGPVVPAGGGGGSGGAADPWGGGAGADAGSFGGADSWSGAAGTADGFASAGHPPGSAAGGAVSEGAADPSDKPAGARGTGPEKWAPAGGAASGGASAAGPTGGTGAGFEGGADPSGRTGGVGAAGFGPWDSARGEGPFYGLTVSGPGLVPYVDPAFRVGGGPVEIQVQPLSSLPRGKALAGGGLLGDVDGNGRVDLADALLIASYSEDPALSLGNGDITLGDVNGDGLVDLADARLIEAYHADPSDASLPEGIGAPVGAGAEAPMLFWTDADGDRIQRSFLDGSGVEDVVDSGLVNPRGLAVDSAAGQLYWTDYGTDKIQRSNLDGSQVEDLVTSGLKESHGLTLGAGLPAQVLKVEGEAATLDLAGRFRDPEGGTLTYTVSSSDEAVATASLMDSELTIAPVAPGRVTVAVTARDEGGRETTLPVAVIVEQKTPSTSADDAVTVEPKTPETSGGGAVTVEPETPTKSGGGGSNTGGGGGTPPPTQNNAPDLVIESPSVSNSSPDAETSFTLSVTVRNSGNGSSATTTLRYYRSTDRSISSSDTQVGTDEVGALTASGTNSEEIEISLTAPTGAGTYYYGACVDAVSGESATGNNCSSGVQVTVTVEGEGPAPDLVVLGLNVSDSTLETGETFGLFPTVHNQGNGSSSATTLRYYRSTDRSISSSDTQVGTGEVGALTASGTNSEEIEISLTAPTDAGTYYYGACVDAVSGESATGNNCSSGVQVTVTVEGEGPAPDLIVLGPNVGDSTPETGGTFWLIVTVHNQGDAQSATTTVRYFRSTDATITTSDMLEGTDVVGEKGPLQNYAATIRLTAPATAGTYYYGACVDAVSEESATGNNCSSGVQVTVSAPPPPPGN